MNLIKLITQLQFFLCFMVAAERLVYVDEIKNLLDGEYILINHGNQERAITFYEIVIDKLQEVSDKDQQSLIGYLHQLEAHELDVEDNDDDQVYKKLKKKIYRMLLVKNKLLTNNLKVCDDTILNNVTINGSLNFNSTNCADINCLTANTITANFITTKTLVADDIIGTFSGVIENALFTEFFTQPLRGDITGTQGATHVELVCGVPACTLAQAYSAALTATSADIPLILVLRDNTGSFAATTITLTGCLVLTDALNNIAGTVCANTKALIVAPQTTRALQTTANGNTRGINAVDLQMVQNGSQVASGNYSGILSGTGNTASTYFAYIGGGYNNNITAAGCVIMGGGTDGTIFAGNSASTFASVIGGGVNNSASGSYAGILSGSGNSIFNNSSNPAFETILGGANNSLYSNLPGTSIAGGGYDGVSFTGNFIQGRGSWIGSGLNNYVTDIARDSCILTGSANTLQILGSFCFLGSGQKNIIGESAWIALFSGYNNYAYGAMSAILSGSANSAAGTAIVFGGGYDGISSGGNGASGAPSFIGSGLSNTANTYSGILSGSANIAGTLSFVGAGRSNSNSGRTLSVIMGGYKNLGSQTSSAILSGSGNTASGVAATIAGGGYDGIKSGGNTASGQASFIGGGVFNASSGNYSGILSGSGNTVSGTYAVDVGGSNVKTSGANSWVAGSNINNTFAGSFVWSDTSLLVINGNAANSFNVRASGGAYITTTTLAGFPTGAMVAPGGATWLFLSDRQTKNNIYQADNNLILNLLSTLPVYTWSLVSQDPSIVHIGPMAQDFHSTFSEFNEAPLYINDSDALGILMASVQALYQNYIVPQELKKKFLEQQNHITNLRKRLTLLEDTIKLYGDL